MALAAQPPTAATSRPSSPNQDDQVIVVGAARHPIRDAYHALLRMPWWTAFVIIVVVFLAANVIFAGLYLLTGGIANAHNGSFPDVFFFSVQTMATIGYGQMYPQTRAANVLMVAESVFSIFVTAIATGLVFTKFSQSTGRLVFSRQATISPMDGVPTLSFRVGNDRSNTVFEATIRVAMLRTERTAEGVLFYRMYDLRLARDRSPALKRSWSVIHTIDENSMLAGETPESFAASELELLVTITGTDDTSLQPVHAQHTYFATDIVWGARPVDILSELPDGRLQLDVARFHDVEPAAPTATFPYPRIG